MSKLNIKVKSRKDEIIFILDGRIDANASENFKNVVMSQIQSKKVNSVIFDCENLEYVSSSGLRVFLSLKQREKVKLKFINISDEVYDIFEVTGFSKMLDIWKTIRDISDSAGQLTAVSSDMIMYQMDDEKIMKLYPHGTELKQVEQDLNLTKTALLSGIPTLISYFIVTYNGRYGIIYEMPNAKPV
ncbi:MAG: STAS domain-containing protein, partial [Synergistaceae bacterium]|nr:STAS domain-containing protein [Synergistaceae bacterium]